MDDDDRQIVHDILGRGDGFGHRQPELLATPGARTQWVAPDRRALPALAG